MGEWDAWKLGIEHVGGLVIDKKLVIEITKELNQLEQDFLLKAIEGSKESNIIIPWMEGDLDGTEKNWEDDFSFFKFQNRDEEAIAVLCSIHDQLKSTDPEKMGIVIASPS